MEQVLSLVLSTSCAFPQFVAILSSEFIRIEGDRRL
jgi:hypothetical protein